eukprot:TRINITY_DN38010_c0_g1_i1.p1 TRINITY_DN38010_c0_g1~~TRINITY_DN38010_c0_g1_i1.p1  ORF type:complete len:288 (-),score=55.30 TRINITY_DN38010_c0_g1_i1:299-1162(-)
MFEELGFLFPYMQLQSFNPISPPQPFHKPMSNLVETAVSEYNLGGEGDLFKAPESIMEEPVLGLDPMTLVSMINDDEDSATRSTKVSDISSIQSEHLLRETFTFPEYNAGEEGDLFKAPVSIMEEPLLECDPMTAAISMFSSGEDAISGQMIKAADIDSFQSGHLLSDVFYECKKDLMEKSAMDECFSKVLDAKIPATMKEEDLTVEREISITGSPMQKSVSSGCLNSGDWIKRGVMRPNFLDFHTMDFETVLGMRRAFSEGDIQVSITLLFHSVPFFLFHFVYHHY